MTPGSPERRVARLLRWYPRSWRHRYGEEFTELLIADITERPRSRSRALDVARGGLVARLASAGLGGCVLEAGEQVRASLAALVLCLAVFLAFGTAMWSQLTTGWQWAAPDTRATAVAMMLMSAAMLAFGLLAVAAAGPVAWRAATRPSWRLLRPSLLVLAGAVILFAGGRHFGNGWPGTGGHRWHGQGLVPGGIGAFSWASTLSVSSFWAHPGALARLPAAELARMALSPAAAAATVGGAVTLVRRTELSPQVLRYEAMLGSATCAVMVAFLDRVPSLDCRRRPRPGEPVPRGRDRRRGRGAAHDGARRRAAGGPPGPARPDPRLSQAARRGLCGWFPRGCRQVAPPAAPG